MRLRVLVRSVLVLALLGSAAAVVHLGESRGSPRPAVGHLLRTSGPEGARSVPRGTPLGMSRWLTHLPKHPWTADRARLSAATVTFASPTYPTSSANTEGAEPSIRVDRTDTNQRI